MAKLEHLLAMLVSMRKLIPTAALLTCLSLPLVEAEVVEWVQRRLSGDFYKYFTTSRDSHDVCHSDNDASTFLVADEQCVNDRDLFIGKL